MKKTVFILFAMSFLLLSCDKENLETQNTNGVLKDDKRINSQKRIIDNKLSDFITECIALNNQILTILEESNSDIKSTSQNLDDIKDEAELLRYFEKLKISKPDKLVRLTKELSIQTEIFYRDNKEFYEIPEADRFEIIMQEIDSQLNYEAHTSAKRTCKEQWAIDDARCERTFWIGVSFAAASGFVSFGWSTVIGYAAVQANMIVCKADANADYEACIRK